MRDAVSWTYWEQALVVVSHVKEEVPGMSGSDLSA